MVKRILRTGLGVIFSFVFLGFLLVSALKFRVLTPGFWKTALEKGAVYQMLQGQVTKMRADLETSLRSRAGGDVPPEVVAAAMKSLAPILSIDKVLTTERFKELVETNIDRLFGYLNAKEKDLVLYLPVKEWNLPVQTLGQPALLRLTAQTPIGEALSTFGLKEQQAKLAVETLKQARQIVGFLPVIWLGLLVVVVFILVGHFFLGVGLVDRVSGTAWLVTISGFTAKLIGDGAGRIFELVATNSKPPLPAWGAALGRSLVSQFFDLGATVGLVLGVAGLVVILVVTYLVKTGKLKKEKEELSLVKRTIAFVLGVTLGFVILGAVIAGVTVAFGGKVDFKLGGSSSSVGSQSKAGGTSVSAAKDEVQKLTSDYYKSEKGWEIKFPVGWGTVKDEKSEGVVKKPVGDRTDWAVMEIGPINRLKEVDSGGYLSAMKQGLSSASSIKNTVLVEEPYEEAQKGTGWRRFVFLVDFDGVIAQQAMRMRLLMVHYLPSKSGNGFVIMARVPVESWTKYEKIIRASVDTFRVGK